MNGNHVKHMLLGGGGILVALLVGGMSLGTALPYALLLACPLMMGAMMFMMMRDGSRGHGARPEDGQGRRAPDAGEHAKPGGRAEP